MSDDRTARARDWACTYTTNPHPDLGRDGVVCPYMVRTVRRNYLTTRPFDATQGESALIAMAMQMRDELVEQAAHLGSDRTYQVGLIVPYGLPEPELKAMVARVHAAVKPEFVESGWMAGDFWPDHQTKGLHNDLFRPFTSPIPILGMRRMVPADLHFFVKQEPTLLSRQLQLKRYRKVFDGQLNRYWLTKLDEAEAAIARELAALEEARA